MELCAIRKARISPKNSGDRLSQFHTGAGCTPNGTNRDGPMFVGCNTVGTQGPTMKKRAPTAPSREKVLNPKATFHRPIDIVRDKNLTAHERSEALNTWEQDARQLMTASNEGMSGRREGVDPADHHEFGKVARAKGEIGERPKHKPSH